MSTKEQAAAPSMTPSSWRDSGLSWYGVVALVFIADQASKLWILANFKLHQVDNIFPFFNLVYVRNYGAAFSFLGDAGGWQRWFFAAIAVGFTIVLSIWLRRQPKSMWRLNLAYTLVIGGALGNLYDRLAYGYVVDFLDFFWNTSHYPAFNIADSAICIGAVLMLWDGFVNPEGNKAEDKQESADKKLSDAKESSTEQK